MLQTGARHSPSITTTSSTSLASLKVSSESRLADEKRLESRKRNLLVLILAHLQEHGYHESVALLERESSLSLHRITGADNMELLYILQEFETYYAFKFGKPAKLVKKLAADPSTSSRRPVIKLTPMTTAQRYQTHDDLSRSRGLPVVSDSYTDSKDSEGSSVMIPLALPRILAQNVATFQKIHQEDAISMKATSRPSIEPTKTISMDGLINVSPITTSIGSTQQAMDPIPAEKGDTGEDQGRKILYKPMPEYGNSEYKDLAAVISKEIFMKNPNVGWNDIAGLDRCKRVVKEAVVYPMKYPELFSGIVTPWKGLLLFGPPGTGKTMLAKAVATHCNTTFFNISASSVVSKWRGDSEKLIRVLFELARYHAPSTIFIDEIESIMSSRAEAGEHEGSRRMKTELLTQIDGLEQGNDHVFVLAASNLPWNLDTAMLRRLEKRVHVPLPDQGARKAMFERNLPANQTDAMGRLLVTDLDYDMLAVSTDGYSGADIKLVCKEAAMQPLRSLFDALESAEGAGESVGSVTGIDREPVSNHHVVEAIRMTRPSTDIPQTSKYAQWEREFGSA